MNIFETISLQKLVSFHISSKSMKQFTNANTFTVHLDDFHHKIPDKPLVTGCVFISKQKLIAPLDTFADHSIIKY